jgi:hypothetical protein
MLCQGEIPASERRLEVQRGPKGIRHFLWQREDKTLGVEAWPFEEDEFSVKVEVHKLNQLKFESEAKLRQGLQKATIEFRSWTFKR